MKEVKKEAMVEDHSQEEQQNEPSSDSEEAHMTIHQYFASKEKPILPSPSSEQAIQKGPSKTRRKAQKLKMVNDDFEVPSSVLNRTEEVRANLDPQYPSFIKMMQHSHVTKGFWLSLPSGFCKMYLPKDDELCILEDEDGEAYKANFLAAKTGLSGGWRAFAGAHNLLKGDAAVFHLVGTCKFKVFIVRAASFGEVDGAIGLLQLDKNTSRRDSRGVVKRDKDSRTKLELFMEDEEGCGRRSTPFVEFESFNIIFNGLNLDFQIHYNTRLIYYELCHARNSYLHLGLLKTISSSLAADVISDTVKIANAIKSSNVYTPRSDFELWDKTLSGFEKLGIEVGFLRGRVRNLAQLAVQPGNTPQSKRYKEAKLEHNQAKEEIKTLEAKLKETQQLRMRLNSEIEASNKAIHRRESRFLQEANAPWMFELVNQAHCKSQLLIYHEGNHWRTK